MREGVSICNVATRENRKFKHTGNHSQRPMMLNQFPIGTRAMRATAIELEQE